MKKEIENIEELKQILFNEETIKYLEDAIVVPSIKVKGKITVDDVRKSFGIPLSGIRGFVYEYWYHIGSGKRNSIKILAMEIWFKGEEVEKVELFLRDVKLL